MRALPKLIVPVTLALAMTVTGCASQGAARTASLGETVRMQVGETVGLPDGATLRYVQVEADSRCRPEVQCIRAGDANVVFDFTRSAQSTQRVTVNTASPSADLGSWKLNVVELTFDRPPVATVRVDGTP